MKKNALIGFISLWLSAHTFVMGMEDGKRSAPEREKKKEYETPPSKRSRHEVEEAEEKNKPAWSAEAQTELFNAISGSNIHQARWALIGSMDVTQQLGDLARVSIDLQKALRRLEKCVIRIGLHSPTAFLIEAKDKIWQQAQCSASRLIHHIGNAELVELLIEFGADVNATLAGDLLPLVKRSSWLLCCSSNLACAWRIYRATSA